MCIKLFDARDNKIIVQQETVIHIGLVVMQVR